MTCRKLTSMFFDNKSGIWPDSIDELSNSRRPPDDDDDAAAAAVDDDSDMLFVCSLIFHWIIIFYFFLLFVRLLFHCSQHQTLSFQFFKCLFFALSLAMFFFAAATLSRSLRFRTKTLNERVNCIFPSPFTDAREARRKKKAWGISSNNNRRDFLLIIIINRGEMRLTVRFLDFYWRIYSARCTLSVWCGVAMMMMLMVWRENDDSARNDKNIAWK